jgi:hypothetical protein
MSASWKTEHGWLCFVPSGASLRNKEIEAIESGMPVGQGVAAKS